MTLLHLLIQALSSLYENKTYSYQENLQTEIPSDTHYWVHTVIAFGFLYAENFKEGGVTATTGVAKLSLL